MGFVVEGKIEGVEIIAVGSSIRESPRLTKLYGKARWRKLKGTAMVRLDDGRSFLAEVHWYEAHGIGQKEVKIKRFLDR